MTTSNLEERLGIVFKNKQLLLEALTQASMPRGQHGWPVGDNGRLRFFGDAILQFLVTEYLYQREPKDTAHWMTEHRIPLVSTKMLAAVGERLGLAEYIDFSQWGPKSLRDAAPEVRRERLLGETMEAILAAYYLDSGMDAARTFLEKVLLAHAD